MAHGVRTARLYHFGGFTLDARTGELSNDGRRTPLRDQSLHLLLALLERPGELITREELTERLWPAGTFVDFERGLNKVVNHLRDALGDSAEQPRFIETLPRSPRARDQGGEKSALARSPLRRGFQHGVRHRAGAPARRGDEVRNSPFLNGRFRKSHRTPTRHRAVPD